MSTLLTVTGPQLKTQVLTALSPTLFFTCHHSQRKGEPHRGAVGRGRRDAGQTWGTGFRAAPLGLSPQWARSSATETPPSSRGQGSAPSPGPS